MGGTTWNPNDYVTRQTTRAATGTSAFVYNDQVSKGQAHGVHGKMNPMGVMRECRDSETHPETLPIICLFDVTGSMGEIPVQLQKKLGQLMATIMGNGYVKHPQILFGAIGDAKSDRAPLQVGQFENGLELDDDLSRIWLEGNGGGQMMESYALGHHFAAFHTITDAYEKRGKKGYLFTMGDECCHDNTRSDLARVFGSAEAGMTAAETIAAASEKYEVFHIILGRGHHGANPAVKKHWQELLGERAIYLDDPDAVCETIASTIGLLEGSVTLDNLATELVASGASTGAAASATKAVAIFSKLEGTAMTKATASGSLGL